MFQIRCWVSLKIIHKINKKLEYINIKMNKISVMFWAGLNKTKRSKFKFLVTLLLSQTVDLRQS